MTLPLRTCSDLPHQAGVVAGAVVGEGHVKERGYDMHGMRNALDTAPDAALSGHHGTRGVAGTVGTDGKLVDPAYKGDIDAALGSSVAVPGAAITDKPTRKHREHGVGSSSHSSSDVEGTKTGRTGTGTGVVDTRDDYKVTGTGVETDGRVGHRDHKHEHERTSASSAKTDSSASATSGKKQGGLLNKMKDKLHM